MKKTGRRINSQSRVIEYKEDNKYWYFKSNKSSFAHITATREKIIQEYFRLLYQAQPKTHFFSKKMNKQPIGILSEGVDNFTPLSHWNAFQFLFHFFRGNLSGFGKICALMMISGENDAKLDNMGTNGKWQLVKIDGNETRLTHCHGFPEDNYLNYHFPVTPGDMGKLPKRPAAAGGNWFNDYLPTDSSIFAYLISKNNLFCKEKNSTILRWLLVPENTTNDMISKISEFSTADFIKRMQQEFNKRKINLREAALKNRQFCDFVIREGDSELSDFMKELFNFIPSDYDEFAINSDEFQTELDDLKKKIIANSNSHYYTEPFNYEPLIYIVLCIALVSYLFFLQNGVASTSPINVTARA